MIDDALHQIERFQGRSLTETIANIELRLVGTASNDAGLLNNSLGVDHSLLAAAAQVKRASAQINVVIHTLGILHTLPYLLEDGEIVQSVSLGAGNAGSDFDLVTNRRIAEFKFIHWQGGSEAVRKKTFFQDYFKLVREPTPKAKYFYLLNTEIPLRFLKGKSSILRMLDRNRRLAKDFGRLYGNEFQTVGEFYHAHKDQVSFVNLVETVSNLEPFIGLPDTQDEA